jgi:hypothetical protein
VLSGFEQPNDGTYYSQITPSLVTYTSSGSKMQG